MKHAVSTGVVILITVDGNHHRAKIIAMLLVRITGSQIRAGRALAGLTIDRDPGFAALTRGDVDGLATDKLVLLAFMQGANPRDFTLLPDDLSFEPFAIVLPLGHWAFRLADNTGLAKIFRSGEIVQIYSKYFGDIGFRPSVWLGAVFTFGGLPD